LIALSRKAIAFAQVAAAKYGIDLAYVDLVAK
jgi:hypothetical protein